jgi:phage baseplate assembly protein W|tara:strand:+ start:112 stop:519 length:408 start_codon:yes stop_codon:yes gene_type:complete
MAFGEQQIFPIDLNNNSAVGVNLPFNGPATFISNYQTRDAIKNNLINFFLTNSGERFLNPNFGGDLKDFIFEQIVEDNMDAIIDSVSSKIAASFPNVIISSLNVLKNEDSNTIIIELKYYINNTNIVDEITLSFN